MANKYPTFETERVIALGIPYIKANGYKKVQRYEPVDGSSTKDIIYGMYDDVNAPTATVNELKEFFNWVNNRETTSDYEWTAKAACTNKTCKLKDFGYILSYINMYFKALKWEEEEKIRAIQRQHSQYAGEVGEKIIFDVTESKILYTIDPYSYYGDYSYAWRLVDEKGNVIIWKTSNSDIEVGDVIAATVKSLGQYRGEKQTVVTRGKIVEYAPREEEEETNPDDDLSTINSGFYDYID